jgi:hypothetical protein
VKTTGLDMKTVSTIESRRGIDSYSGVHSSGVVRMADRLLWLTWRKALLMTAVWAVLLGAHYAVVAMLHTEEVVLFLAAALGGPVWAICAGVYTFDNSMIRRGPPHPR